MSKRDLLADAEHRARHYLESLDQRRVFPSAQAIASLNKFDEPLSMEGDEPEHTLALLDEVGSPATVASNGPHYFGFVIGATLPIADAVERLSLAWDQCASSFTNSPVADTIEKVAARWLLEILDLPRQSAVSFGTSASACSLVCLATARRKILAKLGWNVEVSGLSASPPVRVVVSKQAHITLIKALRILGFGSDNIVYTEVDSYGRIDPQQLAPLDGKTILCLQAGDVNTGEFDPFETLIEKALEAGSWVHVDGAFGLWARASTSIWDLSKGIEGADSWTLDGHKWLNTPYDGAVAICRDAHALASTMRSDADYALATADSQKNLGLEFSRKARGIPIWAALRTLGRAGVASMIERHCAQARRLAEGLRQSGFTILNRVVLNQVLACLDTEEQTEALRNAATATGEIWFGPSVWQQRKVFRLSVSSWRTSDADIEAAISLLSRLKHEITISNGG